MSSVWTEIKFPYFLPRYSVGGLSKFSFLLLNYSKNISVCLVYLIISD
jgi:hypothetical protein